MLDERVTSRMLCARALLAAAASAKTTYACELPRAAAMAPLRTAALRGIFFSRSTGTDRSRTDTILPYLQQCAGERVSFRVDVHVTGASGPSVQLADVQSCAKAMPEVGRPLRLTTRHDTYIHTAVCVMWLSAHEAADS